MLGGEAQGLQPRTPTLPIVLDPSAADAPSQGNLDKGQLPPDMYPKPLESAVPSHSREGNLLLEADLVREGARRALTSALIMPSRGPGRSAADEQFTICGICMQGAIEEIKHPRNGWRWRFGIAPKLERNGVANGNVLGGFAAAARFRSCAPPDQADVACPLLEAQARETGQGDDFASAGMNEEVSLRGPNQTYVVVVCEFGHWP